MTDIQREKEKDRKIFSLLILTPRGLNGQNCSDLKPGDRIQEILPGLPCGCMMSRLWDFLKSFPGQRQKTGWEVGLLGNDAANICAPGVCNVRSLQGQTEKLKIYEKYLNSIYTVFHPGERRFCEKNIPI